MIRHYLKLTWNKKTKHLVLGIELFFAYLVTSFLALFLFSALSDSFKTPHFSSDDLIEINVTPNDTIRQNLQAITEVKTISETELVPYHQMVTADSAEYGDKNLRVHNLSVDENLFPMLDLRMLSGRPFSVADRSSVKKPTVISQSFKELFFAGITAEGKVIKINNKEYSVIGVTDDLNDPSGNYRDRPDLFTLDSGSRYLLKLKTPLNDNIYRKLKRVLPPSNEFEDNITPVQDYKARYSNKYNGLAIFMGIMCGFLIINVVLGLFSMLYQNINSRKSEIAVRRAAGATAGQIYKQIVSEVIMLTTITMIPAVIIAFQCVVFQVFGPVASYYPAMIIGAIIIYILVILCALNPAALASRIQPAEALHEE